MNRQAITALSAFAVILIVGMVFGAAEFAAVVTPWAIMIAIWQVRESRHQARAAFEDGFAREYRHVIEAIPAEALLGRKLSKEAENKSRGAFFRYFDLCNQQAYLFAKGRISEETWTEWIDGIRNNMRLLAFQRAWMELRTVRPDSFVELRQLETNGYVIVHEAVTSLQLPAEEPSEELVEEPTEEVRQAA